MKKFVLLIMCCLFILGTQAQQQNFSRKAIVVNKEQKEESKSNLDKTNVKQERMQFKQNKIGKFLTYSSVKQTLNAAKSVGAVVENFEGSTFPPTSWTILDQDGDGYNWVQSGTVAASPTTGNGGTGKCAMSASYINNIGALTPNNWLITPQVAITAGTAFTFYVSPYGYADHYQVMVSTTDLQPSSFTSIFQETLPATAENFVQKNLTTQLAPYIGENVYIAFVHNSNDEYWMLLDDVAIYDQTACPGANFSNESALVAGNDIDLTWNIDNAPDNYIINVNGINVETNLAGSATSYQIPNSPDGLFEVEITAVFDGCPPVSTTIEDIEIGTPCIWTAALHDDGGDGYGWDGGILAVVQNNFITYYTSMINAEDSIVDIPIYNTTAQFIYVAGGSGWFSYDDENTFTIYDSNDIEVFVSETCDNYDSYEIVYTTDAIPCAAPATNDATITAITSPVTGMNLTATETVIATIKNVGTDAITSMQLGLTVDGGTEVIEPYTGNIVSMATANYTFSATADLSAESSHTITVRAILASDANTANDSKTVTVTNYPIEGTDCANAISYTINTPETTTTMNPMVRETWYAVTVDQNYMNAHFATCPSTFDTKLYIYSSCGGTLLAYNDDMNTTSTAESYTWTDLGTSDYCVSPFTTLVSEFGVETLAAGTYYVKIVPYGISENISGTVGLVVTGEVIQSTDVAVIAITAPTSGINLSNTETVTATIKNLGASTITSMQLGLTVDGGTEVIEPYTGNIVSMATANYTFSANADLSASGTHTIIVRAILSGDANDTNDSKTITVINSICDTRTLPFVEGFEGGVVPSCWTLIDADGDELNWYVEESLPDYDMEAHSGTYFVASASYWSGAVTPDNYLITPKIAMTATSNITMTYWRKASYDPDFAEHYAVMVSTTTNTPSAFTEVYSETLTNTDWTEKTINLTSYAGQNVYIAFRHFNCSNQDQFMLDDINITSSTTSLSDNSTNNISIYPNPSTGLVNIVANEKSNVKVFDVTGKIIDTFSVNAMETTTFTQSAGMYFIQVESNGKVSNHKIVIQ